MVCATVYSIPIISIFLFIYLELKETLESILNQNQILSEVVKTVDSSCPDPFIEPEKFSVFFAQKTVASRSYSEEDLNELEEKGSEPSIVDTVPVTQPMAMENALVRLQNLRMEEQKSFQHERENYETRLAQLSLLQQEIEILRKQNSEHEIQLEFWKCKNSLNEPIDEEVRALKGENEMLKGEILMLKEKIEENEKLNREYLQKIMEQQEIDKAEIQRLESELAASNKRISELELELELKISESKTNIINNNGDELKLQNEQLKTQLEETLLILKSRQESAENQEEKDRQFRELSEENVRLKIEFAEVQKELMEMRVQLNDYEKEAIYNENENETEQTNSQVSDHVNLKSPSGIEENESAFKYIYLSNLVLKFMQFPEKRTALSNIILTTLQADQEFFQNIMANSNGNKK